MTIWTVYILSISLIYLAVFTWLRAQWKLYNYASNEKYYSREFISVVVAIFNENQSLPELLKLLQMQDLSRDSFEVIIVDDYSSTEFMPLATIRDDPTFRFIKNKYAKGKKFALKTGIESARGKIIVTTDADCMPGQHWLSTISGLIPESHPFLLSNPVFMTPGKSFFENFQALEFSSLVATGAASFAIGSPIMCNAANMAFSKQLFLEGFDEIYPNIPTGDDIFLMLYAKKQKYKELHFGKDTRVVVHTRPVKSLRDFLNQRMRWALKSIFYRDPFLVFMASMTFIINLTITSFFILGFFEPLFFNYLLFILLIKMLVDFLFLSTFLNFFGKRKLLKFFLPSQIIYSFYIVVSAIMGFVSGIRLRNHKK